MIINSTKNTKVKFLRSLGSKKGREQNGCYIVEGKNIIKDMPQHVDIREIFVREKDYSIYQQLIVDKKAPVSVMADFVFDSVADTVNSNGILAVVNVNAPKDISGDTVLVLDNIRDAGNMGTIIRTASAMGVVDIIAIDSVEFYNPKVVRSTMGGMFYTNLVSADYSSAKELLQEYSIVALDMIGIDVFRYKAPKKLAIVVGSETTGVSDELKSVAREMLSINMPSGNMESLNAAVSASIALTVITYNSAK